MYSEQSIQSLENRIGFGTMEIPVTVSPTHKVGDSGRVLTWFHKLANLKNIYNTVEEVNMSESDFNDHLQQMKTDAVKSVLTTVFDRNKDYIVDKDYSDLILDRPQIFDEPIGYSLAIAAIEQMVSTTRSNTEERNARFTYDKLKIELEGLKDSYGNVVSSGLKRSQYISIKETGKLIFPKEFIIENYQW